MKIEIKKPLSITSEEETKLQMHSFLNLLNVIVGKFFILGIKIGNDRLFSGSINLCRRIADNIVKADCDLQKVLDKTILTDTITNDFKIAESYFNKNEKQMDILGNFRAMIGEILDVILVRIDEIHIRNMKNGQWVPHCVTSLKKSIIQVFDAIAKASQNRFGIVYTEEAKKATDYYLNLSIKSINGKTLSMPPVLQDVFRDLIANARKYSPIGSIICASLAEYDDFIEIIVSDNGRGIPEDEMEKVVDFGFRARNVKPDETKGGGFGLTKAYHMTKKYKGAMWIESELNSGTTITIMIPKE